MSWTPELIASLENLWNDGLTTTEIGRRLGMSKNAVIGKAHRLGLSGRPSPIRRETRQARPARRIVTGPVCQWPIGDPRLPGFHFCGEPALPGKPYCGSHCASAYTRSSGGGSNAGNNSGANASATASNNAEKAA